MRRLFSLVAFLGLLVTAQGVTLAELPYAGNEDGSWLENRLDAQDARIRELEASLRNQRATVHPISALLNKGSDDGWVDTHNQKWTHKWGGRIMWDQVYWGQQDAGSLARFGDLENYTEFRRLRFFCSGKGYGVYDYKLQFDFAGTDVTLKDAYVGVHEVPLLGYVRVGHFKEPFSMEELTSSKYCSFIERGLPNIFAPSRRVGIAAYNSTESKNLCWAYGVFYNDFDAKAKRQVGDAQGVDLVGRVWATPWYDESTEGRYMVHLGAGAVYRNDRDNTARFRSRPEIHGGARWVDTGDIALDNDYFTVNFEAALVAGSFSLQSEVFGTRLNQVGGGHPEVYGAYITGSWFLTGENRQYEHGKGVFGRVKPLENFWVVNTDEGRCVGKGAWELTARWSYLDLDDAGLTGADRGQLNDVTVGVNWYWNPYTRLMFNWVHPIGDYVVPNGGFNDATGDIIAMRLQLDF